MRYFFIVLMGWLPMLACAVAFDETTQRLPLGREMHVFEDVAGQSTMADVIAHPERLKPHDKATLNAGYSHSVFWLKVDLSYQPLDPSANTSWLLELAYPPLDRIDLYQQNASGEFELTQRTGDGLPFDSRPVKENNYLFELNFTPDKPRPCIYAWPAKALSRHR